MMRAPLNGWQRIWVVIAALWAVLVLVSAWIAWPTSLNLSDHEIIESLNDVPDAAVRVQLTPAENATLARFDAFTFFAAKVGGHTENPYVHPDLTAAPEPDPERLSTPTTPDATPSLLSVHEFAQRIKAKYPKYATWSDDVVTANTLGKYPEYRDMVDPGAIAAASQKYEELSSVEAHVGTLARTIAISTRVDAKRKTTTLVAVAGWAVPVVVLYALGWSIGWVRRGFKKQG